MQVSPWDVAPINTVVEETERVGLENVPWNWLELNFDPQVAIQYAAAVGSWDEFKRQHARNLLRDLREEFHKSPRPG